MCPEHEPPSARFFGDVRRFARDSAPETLQGAWPRLRRSSTRASVIVVPQDVVDLTLSATLYLPLDQLSSGVLAPMVTGKRAPAREVDDDIVGMEA